MRHGPLCKQCQRSRPKTERGCRPRGAAWPFSLLKPWKVKTAQNSPCTGPEQHVSPRAVCKGNRKAAITTPGLDVKDTLRTRVTVLSPALRAAFLLWMEPPPALVVSTRPLSPPAAMALLNHAARAALLIDARKGPRLSRGRPWTFRGVGLVTHPGAHSGFLHVTASTAFVRKRQRWTCS